MLAGNTPPPEPIELAVKRLAEVFRILSNRRRVLIIEELKDAEKDVSSLAASLQLEQSIISKHLAILRAHKLVSERKEGRNIYYRLRHPEIASWMTDGLRFTETGGHDVTLFGVDDAKSSRNRILAKELSG